jgi:acyl-coenzyme A synthetase/AMP-(fatty) acid ligase
MIKVRGWQVSPSELEACLLTHPSIADAAVIGVQPGGSQSELPRAYVVKKHSSDASITESEVYGYLHARLANYKALSGGVEFIDSIPRNSTGKIARNQLRERAANDLI